MSGEAERVLQALAGRPGGRELLELAQGRGDVSLVGGAVRDLLLDRDPRELDVVVDADAAGVARELAGRIAADLDEQPAVTAHERFGTAIVQWPGGEVDIAQRRAESYAAPGALPEVRAGGVQEDLARRDFTVNAIALTLGGPARGALEHAPHALEDLEEGRLRVLHDASFSDDPTRLLRLARYRARLDFEPEQRTAELAAEAIAQGALDTVSRARVGAELRLALAEADRVGSIAALDELGVLQAIDARLHFDASLARSGLDLLAGSTAATESHPDLLLLAALLAPAASEQGVRGLLDELEFPAGERELAVAAATHMGELAAALAAAQTRAGIHGAVAGASDEAVALAGAWGEHRAELAAREWLSELRDVRLLIDGEDLIAAGVPEGPEIGRRLRAALLCKLDGELPAQGREAELAAALEAQP